MKLCAALLFIFLFPVVAVPQSPDSGVVTIPVTTKPLFLRGPATYPYQLIEPEGIFETAPTLTLIPHSANAHPGKIWLFSAPDGLHILGKVVVDEEQYHAPREKSEFLASDHIEIWLATSTDVAMPPIGYGNQFGNNEFASVEECAKDFDETKPDQVKDKQDCEFWYNLQGQYRQYLQRLFVRQWLISSPEVFEDYATTAYAGLNASLFSLELPKVLKPKSDDGVLSFIGEDVRQVVRHDAGGTPYNYGLRTGYQFHFFIPYTAFPPTQQLELKDLYLMVDVFSAAPAGRKMGDYSTTSPVRQWGKPATFNHVRLAKPYSETITPCKLDGKQTTLYGGPYQPWFFPIAPRQDGAPSDIKSTFVLSNNAGGYMYQPLDSGVSPMVFPASYFSQQLSDGSAICGPQLSWRKGDVIKHTNFSLDPAFTSKPLPDGWSLIRSGPFDTTQNPYGSGMCGACTIVNLQIFALSPTGKISEALKIEQEDADIDDSPEDSVLVSSKDWLRVTLFNKFTDYEKSPAVSTWKSDSYCYVAAVHAYKQCGHSEKVSPPDKNDPDVLIGHDE